MHDDVPATAPRLDPTGVDEVALQLAVDALDPAMIEGLDEPGYTVTVVGVDIVPGIVVRQDDDKLESAATIYLDLKSGTEKLSKSRRGIVEFHTVVDAIKIDRVVAA